MTMKAVHLDTEGLDNIQEILSGKALSIRVGILEDANNRSEDEIGNATLGLIHEFGSREKNINENSFLRMPLSEVFPKRLDSLGFIDKQTILKELTSLGSAKKLGEKLGAIAVSVIMEAFATGGFGKWSVNHPTKNRTGMILRDTTRLQKAISFLVSKHKKG